MNKQTLFNRLSFRFSVGIFLLLAVPAGISIAIIGNDLKNDFRQATLNTLAHELDLNAGKASSLLSFIRGEVQAQVDEIEDDIFMHPGIEEIETIQEGPEASFYKSELYLDLISDLKRNINKNKLYYQLRIFQANGQELIRFKRSGAEIAQVPIDKLQSKAHRDYFKHFIEDPTTEVHVHPISLNKDRGKVSHPPTPMIRFGKRIYLKGGELFGVLVLNVDPDLVFGETNFNNKSDSFIIDDEGFFLRHWETKKLFGKELGHDANLLSEEPELKKNLENQDSRIHYDPELKEFRVWKKVFFDTGLGAKKYWVFVERRSEAAIVSPWYDSVKNGLILLVVVIAASLLLSIFFIHKTLSPLKTLKDAMAKMGEGDFNVSVTFKDPTELGQMGNAFNQMAESLKETTVSKGYIDNIIKSMTNSLLILSPDLNIKSVNQAACDLLGYKEEELIGESINLIFVKKEPFLGTELKSLINKGPLRNVEKVFLSKDGHEISVLFSGSIMREGADKIQAVVCVAQDITERKRIEEELTHRTREKAMVAEVGISISMGDTLKEIMEQCAKAIVRNTDESFTAIWLLNEKENVLELKGCAGIADSVDYGYTQIPLGKPQIGLIAGEARPYQTNSLLNEPETFSHEWVKQTGMTAFAGYPIIVEDKTLGVLAVFSLKPFMENTVSALASAANTIALGLERRQVEEDRARLATAVSQAGEAVVITDPDGIIQYVNPAFEQNTGYTSEEAIGNSTNILKSGKVDDTVYREMWETVTHGKSWHGRFTNKRKDGSLYEEDATVSPILGRTGEITSYLAVKRDVTSEVKAQETIEIQMKELQKYSEVLLSILEDTDTTHKELKSAHAELKEKQAQLVQTSKLASIGELAAGVAHELNQPIMVIRGFTQMMLKNEEQYDEKTQRNLEIFEKSTSKMMSIIDHLRTFSRKSVGSQAELHVQTPLEDALDFVSEQLKSENIKVKKDFESDLPMVKGDDHQLEQVFLNLISNARHALDDLKEKRAAGNVEKDESWEKLISIKTGYDQKTNQVWVEISDTGGGIPADFLDKIFDPFFTSKEVGKGTGLGLSISYGIIKEHRGEIEASNNEEGAVFRVSLPGKRQATGKK